MGFSPSLEHRQHLAWETQSVQSGEEITSLIVDTDLC